MNAEGQAPVTVQHKVTPFEAMQFSGNFHDAEKLIKWINGRLIVFPVPTGYEHRLRRKNEFDRSNGHIDDRADPYLAVYRSKDDTAPLRAERGAWFIDAGDEVKVVTAAEFAEIYEVSE